MPVKPPKINLAALKTTPEEIHRQKVALIKFIIAAVITVVFFYCAIHWRIFIFVFMGWVFVCAVYSAIFNKKNIQIDQKLKQFAADNKLEYQNDETYTSNGTLFYIGNKNHKTGGMLIGELYGYAYRLYGHTFTIGHGKSESFEYYAVVEVDLPKQLPNIFIHPISGADKIMEDTLVVFSRQDYMKLEGDFSKHFKVYMIKKYATAGLTIMNPGFMQRLIDQKIDYNIEFIDKKAYLYFAFTLLESQKNMEYIYEATDFIILELQKQLDTFTYKPKKAGDDDLSISSLRNFEINNL